MKKILAVVTAKSDSTRIRHKNKYHIHGKPLYKWTTEFVESWRGDFFSDAIFSSDDPFSFEHFPGWVVCRRPKSLIEDSSPHILSVRHSLIFAEEATGNQYDAVYLFQPTNPIRDQKMLSHATALLELHTHPSEPYMSRCVYRDDSIKNKHIIGMNVSEDSNEHSPIIFAGSLYVYNRVYLLDGDPVQTTPKEVRMMVRKEMGYGINTITDIVTVEAFMKMLGVPYGDTCFYSGQTS